MSSLIVRVSVSGVVVGFVVFLVLLAFGMDESRTGIEISTSPMFALAGAVALGLFAGRFTQAYYFGEDERSQKITTVVFWTAFLVTGSLTVWALSGGAYLGQSGDGFHRDFEWWQAFAAVFACFLTGLAIRRVGPGIRWLAQAR